MNEESGAAPPPPRDRSYLRQRLRLFSDDLAIVGLVLIALLVFLLPSMIITIPAGHLGVHWLRFSGGTQLDHVMEEGTALIAPWNRVFIYDARVQSVTREFEVLSSDGLKITADLAWRYRVRPGTLARLHQYAGPDYAETLLAPSIAARARDVIAVYRPEEIYTQHRLEIQDQISASVRYDLLNRFNPLDGEKVEWLLVEDVLVRRIALPTGVEEAIVRKNMARHEVEQYALIVEREQKETERKRIEAMGIRNFQEIVSSGMTESYLRWRGIEATLELAKSNNAKVVIVGNNRTGGLPLISISGDEAAPRPPPRAGTAAAPSIAPGIPASRDRDPPALLTGDAGVPKELPAASKEPNEARPRDERATRPATAAR